MRHTWRHSGYGGDRGMGGSLVKPSLADSKRRTSTASDQESLSVQSWSMPGSGLDPATSIRYRTMT